ncbi:polymorphic toxin-type HINT domain-containing protein [Planctopirus ephydatiae]|uniref:polymorphic toxin-type HINT domain-containing protein n=1 Tax=Planctopirus ephydatiae TaxID=2528019 RepID=UPI001643EBC2|nr:polymorphic toxin-type HINT domain-containing protein [Planctopirus ephydatiae]
MDSETSQADDLHTDMTFDLASSGFGLDYEITQNQGQSHTKAGSLTDEVVIGGRSRSQDSTTNLWVNLAGYGNWTETSSSGWSETVSDYEFSRRIDKSYWYGRQSYQVSPVSYGRTSNWTSSGSSDRYGPADPYAGGSYQNAIFNPETGMVDYTYADASSPGSDPTGDHGYSEYEGVFESGTAHDLAEWNVTFSNPMSLINQALAPYNYYNLPFIPQAFTNAMGGYEPSYLGDWHLSSEGWASDTQYYKYYENDRTGDWRIDYWDHKPAENETPQRSEYGGPSYDSIQQEAYAAQQQAQSQANQTPPDEAPAAKSADQNYAEEQGSGGEYSSSVPEDAAPPGDEAKQAQNGAESRAAERIEKVDPEQGTAISDFLNAPLAIPGITQPDGVNQGPQAPTPPSSTVPGQPSAQDQAIKALQRLAALQQQFMLGAVEGFVIDGFVGSVQSLKDLLFSAVSTAGSYAWWQLERRYDAISSFDLGKIGWTFIADPSGMGDAALAATKKVKEYQDKLMPYVAEIQSFDKETWWKLYEGKFEELEGQVSSVVLLAAREAHRVVNAVYDSLIGKMSPERAANIAGRLFGMILYEVVEGIVVGAVTAGVGAAVGKSAKIMGMIKRINNFPGLDNPLLKRVVDDFVTTLAKLANTKVCFVAGTMVHTLEGLKPIEQVVKGDLVLTRSEFAGPDDRSVVYRPVVGTIVTQPVELVHLEVTADDGRTETISTTPVHPFFVVEHRGFVHAGKLNAGDTLSLPEGRSAVVASVRRETSDPGTSFTTYNIEIEEMHTYFVGKMGVWVHNESNLECVKATAHFLNLQKAGKLSPAELREAIIDWFREKVAKGELSVESAFKHIDDTLEEVGLPKAGGPIDLTPKGIAPRFQSGSPGSPEHKANRWEEYKEKGGKWDYNRWEQTYELNMARATKAHEALNRYHSQIGWGKREVTIPVEGVNRRLDIADVATRRGIEYKTGYQSATQDNLWEVERDKALVNKGWDIEWVFEGQASQQLLEALDRAGIRYSFR